MQKLLIIILFLSVFVLIGMLSFMTYFTLTVNPCDNLRMLDTINFDLAKCQK